MAALSKVRRHQLFLLWRAAPNLVDEVVQPFRFLDIACGDARASVDALKRTRVAQYHGIDLSQEALDLASQALETLACPVTLDHRDFVAALRDWPEPVDIAWTGLSLHHLLTPAKLELMREIRGIVGDSGLLLIYENAAPDGEDREAWLLRCEDQAHRLLSTALNPEEFEAMLAHVRANDFPETTSRWQICCGGKRMSGPSRWQRQFNRRLCAAKTPASCWVVAASLNSANAPVGSHPLDGAND